MGSFGILQALIFEPKKAFTELDARPRVLFPLVLLLVTTLGMLFWYFSVADLDWLIAQSTQNDPRAAQMTDEQRRVAAEYGPIIAKWSTLIGGAIVIVCLRLLEALYYLLAGKIMNVQRSYKHWLSLSVWSSLPAVLGVIPAAVVLLTTTTTQFDQGQLQSLSLNNLLFHRTMDEPGYTLLTSMNVLQLLCVYLAAFGVRAWSGRSWLFSIVYASLPMVLIYGVWGYFALGRS
jgi:hypothetical protein